MTRVAILAGTGVHDLGLPTEPILIESPFGDVEVLFAREGSLELFFLNRHGAAHRPAHVVSHKANVDALARCRVERIVALNSVGALRKDLPNGTLLCPDDYIDLRAKKESFFDDSPVHVDVSEAYCPTLRSLLVADGARDGGTYVATEGPRLETRAEVRMLHKMGGDVVGMTGCPEAALAREREMCYASLCMVTNPAAGVVDTPVSADAIRGAARDLAPRALTLALSALRRAPATRSCGCPHALDSARL